MKVRKGFVSNSSSSSFVLDKSDMTDDQIKEFWNLRTECDETCIFSSARHFYGTVSMHESIVYDFLQKYNLGADIGC